MESIAISSQRYRIDTRYRRWAQNNQPDNQQTEQTNKNRGQIGSQDRSSSPPQKERERRRSAMTRDHRLFHRRQAGAVTEVLTVSVDVIATVDTSGNTVGQETRTQGESAAPTVGIAAVDTPTPGVVPGVIPGVVPGFVPGVVPSAVNVGDSVAAPVVSAVKNVADLTPPAVPVPAVPSLPQVPAVPAVPTVALPVVPAVPPFPTDLTVPAYPFATGASAVVAQVSSNAAPSPAPTSVAPSSAVSPSASAALNNSSVRSSSPSSASAVSGRSASTSATASDSASASSPTSSSDSDEAASSRNSSATSNPSPNRTTYYNGPGGVVPVNTADPAQTTAAVGSSNSGPTTPLQTPQVVGSVVGSLAGAALILAIILFLLKRHKRQRRGALQLTNDDVSERAAPPMSQDPSRNNRIPSAFLNRFSGMSKSTIETNTSSGERSFQRVSGRKLPSAFSEGMTSDQFSRGGTLSGSSFYQDDQGIYGGPGMSKEFGKEVGGSSVAPGAAAMNIRPGPGRTPVIRHPDDEYVNPFADPAPFPKHQSHLSPPQSPNPDVPRGTLGRSLYSHDGSRSSKFTENV